MSGTPQKMLEHLLETRLDGQAGPNDPFLDDFLLTHIVFMPIPMLINELANLYPFYIHRRSIHSNYFILQITQSVRIAFTANGYAYRGIATFSLA